MANENNLEERVATLERIVADLRQQLPQATNLNWVERMKGSVADLEAFDKAMEYGRHYRNTGRLPDAECEAP